MEYKKIDSDEDLESGKGICFEVNMKTLKAKPCENNPHVKTSEDCSMSDSDYYFKVEDITAEPQIGDKTIECDFYVRIMDMREHDSDYDNKKNHFVGELQLIPKVKHFGKKFIKRELEDAELKKFPDLSQVDVIEHGFGVRMGEQVLGSNVDKIKTELADQSEAAAGLIGFYLDRAWNQIGTTGWDSLNEILNGKSAIQETLRR